MWEMWLLRFMHDENLYTLYPWVENGAQTIVCNWRERGLHFEGGSGQDFPLATSLPSGLLTQSFVPRVDWGVAFYYCMVGPLYGGTSNQILSITWAQKQAREKGKFLRLSQVSAEPQKLTRAWGEFFDEDAFPMMLRDGKDDERCAERVRYDHAYLHGFLVDPAGITPPPLRREVRERVKPGKEEVTVHGRSLDGECALFGFLCVLPIAQDVQDVCDYSQARVRELFGIPEGTALRLFTDGQDPAMASTYEIVDTRPFPEQLWAMVVSPLHIGNPKSSMDFMISRWRQGRGIEPAACYSSCAGVKWVLLVHLSEDSARHAAVMQTWARAGPGSWDVAFIFFGKGCKRSARQGAACTTKWLPGGGKDDFAETQRALAFGMESYPSAQLFAKFDDDTYVYSKRLLEMERAFDYAGSPIRNEGLVYGSGGAGYVLSRRAAGEVMRCAPPTNRRFEDLSVGWCMHNAGIALKPLVGMHSLNPFQTLALNHRGGQPSDRVVSKEPIESFLHPLSYHYVSPEEMVRMHWDGYTHGFSAEAASGTIMAHVLEEDAKRCPATMVWNPEMVKRHFPSKVKLGGLNDETDGHNGLMLMHDMRLEVLMHFGGVFVGGEDCTSSELPPLSHAYSPLAVSLVSGLLPYAEIMRRLQ